MLPGRDVEPTRDQTRWPACLINSLAGLEGPEGATARVPAAVLPWRCGCGRRAARLACSAGDPRIGFGIAADGQIQRDCRAMARLRPLVISLGLCIESRSEILPLEPLRAAAAARRALRPDQSGGRAAPVGC